MDERGMPMMRSLKHDYLSIGTIHIPERPLMDLPECPPSIYNKKDQGQNSKSKSGIPIDKSMVHWLSLFLSLILPFILISQHNPHRTPRLPGCSDYSHLFLTLSSGIHITPLAV
jgi:hypothetical protein